MPDQWKTVRLREPLYERLEVLAKAAERSVANYVESLLNAGLARAAGRVPAAKAAIQSALTEADAKGAAQAAVILRTVLDDWS